MIAMGCQNGMAWKVAIGSQVPPHCMHQKPFSHPVLGLCKNGDGSGCASQEVDLCPFGSGEMMREEKHFLEENSFLGDSQFYTRLFSNLQI